MSSIKGSLDGTLQPNFLMCISGPSMSGKSTFCKQLLINNQRLFSENIENVIIFTGSNDNTFHSLPKESSLNIKIIVGLPKNLDEYIIKNTLYIFDDLQEECGNNKSVSQFFTKHAHHQNISVILILQNLYAKGSERITMLRNCHYLVIFNNPLDQTILNTIARRIDPPNHKKVLNMFKIVLDAYRYILIDGSQNSSKSVKYRSDIFHPHFQRIFSI
jgi:uridine kinase